MASIPLIPPLIDCVVLSWQLLSNGEPGCTPLFNERPPLPQLPPVCCPSQCP